MTSTRPRFFSLHKVLTFFLFLFVFSFSVQGVFAQETVAQYQQRNGCAVQASPGNRGIQLNCGGQILTCGSQSSLASSCTGGATPNVNSAANIRSDQQRADEGKEYCAKKGANYRWIGPKKEDCKNVGGWLCSEDSIAGCLSDIADFVVGGLVKIINGILSWVLSIAMYLLDLVIYITVVKFTQNFAELKLDLNPSGSLGGIGSGTGAAIFGSNGSGLIYYIWGMLRDFVNLLLLITIIYYAVHTMFQGFSAHKDKFLYLLIFSIVINFSLFFVKFAIDISNILSLQAYTLMANPQSFETWEGFRKNASGGGQTFGIQTTPNATLGDYLLNIASIGGAHKKSVGADAAEQRINEGMKASWVYQVIVMLMYIGLIYIVFYLAGLLVMRAAAFLFAMLLAALLAVDVFFSIFKQGDVEFVNEISKKTTRIKDDFYQALIKGPVLFLFLFLVGVLSNAIFNQSLQAEITSITNNSEEFKVFGNAFSSSLAIFLKFALFFTLTKVLFDKLGVMKFGDNSWLGKYSTKGINYASRTLGFGSRAIGYAGQNTIGRWASDRDSRFGRVLNNINNSERVQNWKNADGGTIVGKVQRRLGGAITGSIKGIKDGSYDLVGATGKGLKKADDKIGGRIAKAVDKATFGLSDNSNFGPGVTTTRDQRDQASADERKKKRDAELAATEHSNVVSAEYYEKAASALKIKDLDDVSLKDLENMVKSGTGMSTDKQREFVTNYRSENTALSVEAGRKLKGYQAEAEKKAVEDAHHDDEHLRSDIQKEYMVGKRRAESYAGMAQDVGSLRGLGSQRSQLGIDSAKQIAGDKSTKADADAAKKNKEAREFAGKVTAVADFISETDSALSEIKTALDLDTKGIIVLSSGEKDGLEKLEMELTTAKSELPSGKIDADKIKTFTNNSTLHDKVYAAKRKAAEQLMGIFDKGTATVEALSIARKEAAISYNAINKSEPAASASTLRSVRSTSGPTEADRRVHERRVVEAKAKLDFIDRALSTAFANAQKIEQRIGPSIEKLEKLKAKPEEKKP